MLIFIITNNYDINFQRMAGENLHPVLRFISLRWSNYYRVDWTSCQFIHGR